MTEPKQHMAFARLLKFWRGVHGLSQEELAHRLQSSPRHISRLENGSSRPSEAIIELISEVMALGQRDRNHLRIGAGYGALQKKVDFHAPELKWLRKAMSLSLKALNPYPTTLTDSAGNMLMVNRAWVGFYSEIMSPDSLDRVTNQYAFLFNRQEAGTVMSGWQDTLSVILMSLQQAALMTDDPEIQSRVDELKVKPGVPEDWLLRAARLEPMASFRIDVDFQGAEHQFFSVSQTVGALGPTAYVSEPQLTISTLYPEDHQLDLSHLLEGDFRHPLMND